MAEVSAIAWTHSTFNPWIGCTKVSPGCDHCYAETLDARHKWGGAQHWGAGVPRRRTSLSNWRLPEKWDRAAKASGERHLVFCASLADVFDNEAPEGAREDLWQLIRSTPHLTWQLVTKRIGNARAMLPADWGDGYPNVWLLSTIVDQNEAERDLWKLLSVPARVHGVSYEPALGPVNWTPWLRQPTPILDHGAYAIPRAPRVDWLIVGGESGNGARHFAVSWARTAIEQCRAEGVPVFVKQLGAHPMIALEDGFDQVAMRKAPPGYKWDDPAAWPEWLRVREFPR